MDKIEILSTNLLDEQRQTVTELKQLAVSLKLEFGWHYLLDLAWIINCLRAGGKLEAGLKILDAGAGTGVLQWYLADHGAEVISVDRMSRADLPLRFRNRFQVVGMRKGNQPDLYPPAQMLTSSLRKPRRALSQVKEAINTVGAEHGPGKVILYNQDLKHLTDIPDASLDAVVAVSAL